MYFADTIELDEPPETTRKGRLARDQLKSKIAYYILVNLRQKIAPLVAILLNDAARNRFNLHLSIHSHGRTDDGLQRLSDYPAAF